MPTTIVASTLVLCVFLTAFAAGGAASHHAADRPTKSHAGVLDFTMTTIDGAPKKLSAYRGKVVMIVNTASECGYTPQYETLEKLYETYKAKGFTILAFPANNFGAQEPGTNPEIKTFCTTKYHTTFDLFEKISVKGSDQHPLYQYLTKDSPYPGDVKWNFQKYLVDRNGKVAARFMSAVDPMSPDVRTKVEELLAQQSK
jgi:glutathione peroxidase